MPRVISDELYEDLVSNINQQRLLGIMGKLERLRDEAEEIFQHKVVAESAPHANRWYHDLGYLPKGAFDETKTNDN